MNLYTNIGECLLTAAAPGATGAADVFLHERNQKSRVVAGVMRQTEERTAAAVVMVRALNFDWLEARPEAFRRPLLDRGTV